MNWYDSRTNLVELLDFMEAIGLEIDDIKYFIEKPEKWDVEFAIMTRNANWRTYSEEQLDELQDAVMEQAE